MPAQPLILRLASPGGFLACSSRTDVNGVPRQRFRKELVRKGEYVDVKNSRPFTVTDQHLDNWAEKFAAFRAGGIKVNIPATHDGAADPDKNRGWVEDIIREGDSLFGILEMIGEDGILAAARNDVSIFSPEIFKDGKGNTYAWPITHVALCPDPLFPGLGGFVPLAASRGTATMTKLPDLLKALGITDAVTTENSDSLIDRAIAGLKKSEPAAGAGATATATGGAAGAAVVASQGAAKREADPLLVKTVAELRRTKLEGLVNTGKITPAVRDTLAKQWIGENNGAIVASVSAGNNGDDFDSVVAAFAANEPIKLGSQTGAQTQEAVALAASIGGGAGNKSNPLVDDAEERAKRAAGK